MAAMDTSTTTAMDTSMAAAMDTAQQKTLLKRCIGTVRWTYNQCVAAVRGRQCAPTKKALRARFVTEFGLREAERIKRAKSGVCGGGGGGDDDVGISWVFETLHDLRDQAVGQFVTAYKNAVQAHGRGKFDIAFRSAKRLQQETVVIRSRDWNRTRGEYAPIFGNTVLRSSESLPAKMDHEFRVTRTKLGRYYISIPVPLLDAKHPIQQQQPGDVVGGGDNQAPAVAPHAAAAIDPGVRTPFTVSRPEEARVYELGANDFGRIRRLCHHLDEISSAARPNATLERSAAAGCVGPLLVCAVDDLYRRAAKWLCKTLRPSSTRTTRPATWSSGFRTDRDWNGERNIWLKFLTEWCNDSGHGNDDDYKEQQQQQQQHH